MDNQCALNAGSSHIDNPPSLALVEVRIHGKFQVLEIMIKVTRSQVDRAELIKLVAELTVSQLGEVHEIRGWCEVQ